MPATRDGKTWRSQFYYEDWQGIRHKKNKRGFKTKAEAEEWERNFRQQQRKDLDINFKNFVEIYFTDIENRLRESTIKNKRYVFDLKVQLHSFSYNQPYQMVISPFHHTPEYHHSASQIQHSQPSHQSLFLQRFQHL